MSQKEDIVKLAPEGLAGVFAEQYRGAKVIRSARWQSDLNPDTVRRVAASGDEESSWSTRDAFVIGRD